MEHHGAVAVLGLLLAITGRAAADTGYAKAVDTTFDLAKPIREYLGDNRAVGKGQLSLEVARSLSERKVTVVIATVPDPADSIYRYRFDFFYGAIQSALEAANYLPDRFILPWPSAKDRLAQRDRAKSEKRSEANQSESVEAHEPNRHWPGLVLFRKSKPLDSGGEELLALLLVGETSTWGVDKVALQRCLEFRRVLRAAGVKVPRGVFVLGPTFTGSFSQLVAALAPFKDPLTLAGFEHARQIHSIINGTMLATFLDLCDAFDLCTVFSGSATGVTDADAKAARLRGVTFRTTVHNDDVLLTALRKFLCTKDKFSATPRRIALLVPGETVQGQNISRSLWDQTGTQSNADLLVLPFPPHLSAARGTADDLPTPSTLETDPAGARGPAKTGPLALEEDATAGDFVPPVGGSVTPTAEALLLAKTLATISREDIRYVGIFSSDTRDNIYLARLIARYCPDVQVFFNSNDLLVTFPDYAQFVEGAIVASTYPLFSPSQAWDFPFAGSRRRLMFSSEFDQGYYNATLLLLKKIGEPDPTLFLIDYGYPTALERSRWWQERQAIEAGSTQVPPVWINVVGKYGPWPVTVERSNTTKGNQHGSLMEASAQAPRKHDYQPPLAYTLPWAIAFAVASLLGLLFCDAYVTAFPVKDAATGLARPQRDQARLLIMDFFRPVVGDKKPLRVTREQRVYVVMLFSILLGTYLTAFWPAAVPLLFSLARDGGAGALVYAMVLCVIAGVVVAVVAWPPRPVADEKAVDAEKKGVWVWIARLVAFKDVWVWIARLVAFAVLAIGVRWIVLHYNVFMAVAVPVVATVTTAALLRVVLLNFWNLDIVKSDRFWFLRRWETWVVELVLLVAIGGCLAACPLRAERFPESYFSYLRAVYISSSVSPTISTLLLGAALWSWPLCQLLRLRLLASYLVPSPFTSPGRNSAGSTGSAGGPASTSSVPDGSEQSLRSRLAKLDEELTLTLRNPCTSSFFKPLALACVVAFSVFLIHTAYRMIPDIEGPVFSVSSASAFLIASFLYLFVFLHSYRLVGLYIELLRQIAYLPMADAYDRLPRKVSFTFGKFLSTFKPRPSNLTLVVQQLQSLLEFSAQSGPSRRKRESLTTKLRARIEKLRKLRVVEAFEAETRREYYLPASGSSATPEAAPKVDAAKPGATEKSDAAEFATGEATVTGSETLSRLNQAVAICLDVLPEYWQHRAAKRAFQDAAAMREPHATDADGDSHKAKKRGGHTRDEAERNEWLDHAEEFVALAAVGYVSQFSLHIRNNIYFLTACPIFLLLAVNNYPFQPHRLLGLSYWILTLITLIASFALAIKLDRDEFLSRVSKTRPANISWSSVSARLAYLVPLLGVLLTQYPDVSDFLYTQFGPLFRVLEK